MTEKITTTLIMEKELYKKMRIECFKEEVTMSQFIETLVQGKLEGIQ